jgi:hypothetical protein
MKDPVNVSEAAHDRPDAERVVNSYKEEALTSIVEDLMAGEKVDGWTLQDHLENWAWTIPEILAAAIISDDYTTFENEIERLLKAKLQDSDAVSDRCWELDQAEKERAQER